MKWRKSGTVTKNTIWDENTQIVCSVRNAKHANLIAAAPNMLEALKDVVNALCNPWCQQYAGANYTCLYCNVIEGKEHKSDCEFKSIEKSIKAISKAEGNHE